MLREAKSQSILEQDEKLSRKIAIYLSHKYTAKTLNEIADFYGNIRRYTGKPIVPKVRAKKKRKSTIK